MGRSALSGKGQRTDDNADVRSIVDDEGSDFVCGGTAQSVYSPAQSCSHPPPPSVHRWCAWTAMQALSRSQSFTTCGRPEDTSDDQSAQRWWRRCTHLPLWLSCSSRCAMRLSAKGSQCSWAVRGRSANTMRRWMGRMERSGSDGTDDRQRKHATVVSCIIDTRPVVGSDGFACTVAHAVNQWGHY